MLEPFKLPVTYKGKELLLDAQFSRTGYLHKITVDISGVEFIFEPDEERNYRAISSDAERRGSVDPGLIAAVVAALEDNFKTG